MPNNLEKLNRLAEMFNPVPTVSVADFQKFFDLFSKALKTLKDQIDSKYNEISSIASSIKSDRKDDATMVSETVKTVNSKIDDMKSFVTDSMSKMEKMCADMMTSMQDEMESSMDKMTENMPEMPEMPEVPDITPLQNQIVEIQKSMTNSLDELRKEIESIKQIKPSSGKMTGMRKVPIIKSVSLTSQVNGNTRSFKLPRNVTAVLGLWSTSFPITFDSTDWTLSGNTLILATGLQTPQSGQTLVAIIETLFYS